MSRDKQIKEMANDLRKSEFWYFDDTDCDFLLERKKTAENLYNAGYRKASEVARNIFVNLRILGHIDFDGNMCIRKDSFEKLEKKYTEGGRDKIAEFGKYSPLSWKYTEEGK